IRGCPLRQSTRCWVPSGVCDAGSNPYSGSLLRVWCGGHKALTHRQIAVEDAVPDTAREGADLGVVALNGADIVTTRHRDAVYRPLPLWLPGQEIQAGCQIRISSNQLH